MRQQSTETRHSTRKPKAIKQRIVIKFPPRLTDKPILCKLTRDYNLDFNILRAQVSPEDGGLMVLEISGDSKSYESAIQRLHDEGISTQMLSRDVSWDELLCTQCGACVTLCPSGALISDPKTHVVSYDSQKCFACEYCILVCPTHAMSIQF
jgi:ferredoxin